MALITLSKRDADCSGVLPRREARRRAMGDVAQVLGSGPAVRCACSQFPCRADRLGVATIFLSQLPRIAGLTPNRARSPLAARRWRLRMPVPDRLNGPQH
eukprot:CAMPEP_0195122812 /NCGR_PEP_ID=MMETSP0448-20130528/127326_1 /TAXON_ID=66468 /ORGANISM="Heterocapsa triquestra, Strain CCMP 448" /LENGTH=99 /DNA_ID=CAMNT_0040160323 /DNA_START=142 /DNA_END=438 /DNA_ORIENTATION=+